MTLINPSDAEILFEFHAIAEQLAKLKIKEDILREEIKARGISMPLAEEELRF